MIHLLAIEFVTEVNPLRGGGKRPDYVGQRPIELDCRGVITHLGLAGQEY